MLFDCKSTEKSIRGSVAGIGFKFKIEPAFSNSIQSCKQRRMN